MKIHGLLGRALVLLSASFALLSGAGVASATITIATVPVGNPGNAADPADGFGSVGYNYNIGEYDVTSSQYTAFLNSVAQTDTFSLYNSDMAFTNTGCPGIIQSGSSGSYAYSVVAGRNNFPMTCVTFWDTLRFANWLDNGQPTGSEGNGTTETGTYTLTPTTIANNTVVRNTNLPAGSWALASENEWYKAAYYNPAGSYTLYAVQANTISTLEANYQDAVGDTTAVGSYAFPSYYGTYDQNGDVYQWNESTYYGSFRGLRGGSFDNTGNYLQAGNVGYGNPPVVVNDEGFRVSQVPEPGSLGILALGGVAMLVRRRGVNR